MHESVTNKRGRLVLDWLPAALLILGLAAQSSVPATHAAEWTNLNDSDPGVTESVTSDLQKVVVLCATQPGSPEFDATWIDWVRGNPGADIETTISKVISQAGTIDSMSAMARDPLRPTRKQSKDAIAERMRHLAGTVQRTLRSNH